MKINFKLSFVIILLLIFVLNNNIVSQSNYLNKIGVVDSIHSNILKETRKYWIQYPENYNPAANIKYPVLYVLDGSVHLNAVSTVQQYYSGGFFPEMIIIGVSNQKNRTRDLTTSKIDFRRGTSYNQETGEAEYFTQFIKQELIPYVENKYPVTNYRTIIGHSYAGLFVINTLINHTELFNNYIAIDPSLDWDNQKLLNQSKEIMHHKKFTNKTLFMSLGGVLHMQNSDITIDNVMNDITEFSLFARSNLEFSKLLDTNKHNGLRSNWKFYERDFHGTIPLPSIMDGLIYLFDWYPIEHTDKFNDPITPIDELIQIIENRALKLENHFGYSVPPFEEDLFNMLGYMNLDMGQIEKSQTFFNLNIKHYPKSENVYDSIADFYMAQKNYDDALKNLEIAFKIGGNKHYKKRISDINQLKKN